MIAQFPKAVVICMGVLLQYLRDFQLDRVFILTGNIHPFGGDVTMKLSGNTLFNLELLSNNTTGTEKGSLYWVLNHTSTAFGARLLKKWVQQPLVDAKYYHILQLLKLVTSSIRDRLDAVEELAFKFPQCLGPLFSALAKVVDIEKGICRIHYLKSSPSEYLAVLQAFQKYNILFFFIFSELWHPFLQKLIL